MSNAILPMSRVDVHLSKNFNNALHIARRHGRPVILTISVKRLMKLGHKIYASGDGVYLVDNVPLSCITAVNTLER